MYNREILPPRAAPLEDGIPLQGTWTQGFKEVDLLRIQRPYAVPLPRWIQDWRVKEWESFTVQDDTFSLRAALFNLKFCGVAQLFFYDRIRKERVQIQKLLPLGVRLPRNLNNSSIESRAGGFFFRVHNWLDTGSIRADLNIRAGPQKPAFTAHLTFDMNRKRSVPMAVNLLFAERRCVYAYKAQAAVRGDIVLEDRYISLNPAKTTGLFCDYKGYYPYRMRSLWCTGMGFDGENRRLGFSIGENQTKESYKNNENALWMNGRLTPLPPVRVTIPNGPDSDWIIQDMEGMVDLTFSPKEPNHSALNLIVAGVEYDMPLGCYNGMFVNSDGEKIPVRNFWGLGEKLYLRV